MPRNEENHTRTPFFLFLFFLIAIPVSLAFSSLLLDVSASDLFMDPAFIGSPTPPPIGTPSPPVTLPHTIELVQDIFPGGDPSRPIGLTPYKGDLYFGATGLDSNGIYIGQELFKFDGSQVSLVEDINPGGASSTTNSKYIVYDEKLIFNARGTDLSGNPVGNELFSYDGISVELISDINPVADHSSTPKYFVEYDGVLYFSAEGQNPTGQNVGEELFKFDGSHVSLAADIVPGSIGSYISSIVSFNGKLYISARDINQIHVLYEFDGTTLTKVLETPIGSGVEYLGNLYFSSTGEDQYGNPVGTELFRFDGSQVSLVADLNPNIYQGVPQSSHPDQLVVHDGNLFFVANINELYLFNGYGVFLVRGFFPWAGNPWFWSDEISNVKNLTTLGNGLFFQANYYDMFTHSIKIGLHRFDLNQVEFIDEIYISDIVEHDGDFLISGDDRSGIGVELWRLDADPDFVTTTQITDINPYPSQPGEAVTIEVSTSTAAGPVPAAIVDIGDGEGNNCQAVIVDGTGSCNLIFSDYGQFGVYARFELGTEYLSSSDDLLHSVTPVTPTGLMASDGVYLDKIAVSWSSVPDAISYLLYRASSENGTKEQVYDGPNLNFDDTAVTGFDDYYYFVSACTDIICSVLSNFETGYLNEITAPSSLTASDGAYPDKIIVSWSSVPDATEYILGRATSESGPIGEIYSGPDLTFDDDMVSGFGEYFYFVYSCYNTICSEYSSAESGYLGDFTKPTGNFIKPLDGGTALQPRTVISASASDNDRVKSVIFSAYYDNAWHQIHTDTDGSDGWEFLWANFDISSQNIKLEALIEDNQGNQQPILLENVSLTSIHISTSGQLQSRTSSGPGEESIEVLLKSTEVSFVSQGLTIRCRTIPDEHRIQLR